MVMLDLLHEHQLLLQSICTHQYCTPTASSKAHLPKLCPTTEKLLPATEQSCVPSKSRFACLFEVPGADLLQCCAHTHSRKRKCSSVVNEEVEVQFTES